MLTWKAKNVKNDYLDMRVAVWITSLSWMEEQVVVGTGYGQLRIYDMKQKRPVLDVKIATHPIKTLLVSGSEILLSDTLGNLSAYSVKGDLLGKYKGIAGEVTAVAALGDFVISAGLDRKLRIFEAKGERRLVKEVYLKQKLTSIVALDDEPIENEDEEWEGIPEVTDGKRKLTK